MSARDVIAQALHDQIDLRFGAVPWEDDCARVAIEALTAAGFSIVHKDEIHAPSVERCVAWHDLQASVIEGQCEAITKDGGWPDRSREANAKLHRTSAAALRELMKEVGRE